MRQLTLSDMPWKQKALDRWAIAVTFDAIWLRVDDGLGDFERSVEGVVELVELEIKIKMLPRAKR